MPAPPMPAIQIRLPASGCEGDELIRDLFCCVGFRDCAHRRGHGREAVGVAEQLLDHLRRTGCLGLANEPGTSTAGSPAAASSQTEPPARARATSAAPYATPISSINGLRM